VLYLPGAKPAFLRFDCLDKLNQWVIDQTKDPKKASRCSRTFRWLIVRTVSLAFSYNWQAGSYRAGALQVLATRKMAWTPSSRKWPPAL